MCLSNIFFRQSYAAAISTIMAQKLLFTKSSNSYHLTSLLILSILCHTTNAALISAQSEMYSEDNETNKALSFLDSSELDSDSINENSVLTDPQSIKLKEIRKLARLAGHEHPENITDFDQNLCYLNACLETAKEFFSSMDFSKDPCKEWTKFACEWRTLSSKSATNQQSELDLKNENQVLDILQDPNIETDRLRYANLYFSTCKNWFQEFNQVSQITAYLKKIGNWPLLNGGSFEGDWDTILIEILRTVPENVFPFLLKLEAAAINDDQIVLQIDSGATYIEMDSGGLRELLQLLRASSRTAQDTDLEDIKEMETTMKILSSAKFNQAADDKPSLIKLNNLQDKLKAEIPNLKLNIISLLQGVFAGTDLKITDQTEVLIDAANISKYFTAIHSVNETNLVNILFLQLAIILLGDTTDVLDMANFPYLAHSKRSTSGSPLYDCLMETSELFNYALSEEYVRRYYNQRSNEMTNKIVEILKIGFINTISSIKWLEAESKTFIQGKVQNMSVRVGFPEWIIDESSLVSYYSTLKISENIPGEASSSYLSYRQTVLAWLNGKSWKMKLNDDIMDGWNYKQMNGFVGNSIVEYIPNLNQIRIPAGALQMPLYSIDYPGFMNFGGIGSVIAREMARIIDLKGIALNSDGEPGMWLDEKSYKSYVSWSARLKSEWESHLNEPSLNNKLISVIAFHITVEGYKEYLKLIQQADQEEIKVPGLISLQPEKLLQIKYTNVLCEDENIKSHHRDWSSQPFTGRQGMVPVAQSEYFFKLFQCNEHEKNTAFDFA